MSFKFKPAFILYAILSFALSFGSCCGGADKPAESAQANDSLAKELADSIQAFFQIPMPGEYYAHLKRLGLKSKPGLLNPVANIASYTGSKEKAINFGIYSSDLFYSSNFDQKADVLKIFNNLRKLAEEMGIASVISENLLKRIEKNLANNDSLNSYANDVFFDASANLEKNGQGASLALMLAGGFIESIYISTELAAGEKEGGAVYQYLADQKFPLENLFHFLERHKNDSRVSEVITAMAPLKNAFEAIKAEPAKSSTNTNEKRTIGAGSTLILSSKQFKEIKEIATAIRTEFTSKSSSK